MYKLLLCWRYLRTRYIALASIISVTLGVATLIVVNSVMQGFNGEMKTHIRGVVSDVVFRSKTMEGMNDFEWHAEKIREVAGDRIEAMSPMVVVPAMLNFQRYNQWYTLQVNLVGIDERTQNQVSKLNEFLQHPDNRRKISFDLRENGYDVHSNLSPEDSPERKELRGAGWEHRRKAKPIMDYNRQYGRNENIQKTKSESSAPIFDPFANHPIEPDEQHVFDSAKEQHTGVVLGIATTCYRDSDGEDHFLVIPGDDIKLTFPTVGQPPKAVSDNFTVVDFFECKMSDYDSKFVFMPIRQLQELRGMVDPTSGIGRINAIQIKVKPGVDENSVRDDLRRAFSSSLYVVNTWFDEQGAFLMAVDLETRILNLLLFMIIAVAGFGILAIFYMIVVEKTRDIGILKSLGASSGGIMGIFLSYGLLLGLVGSGAGMVIGLLFVHYINEIAGFIGWMTGQPVFDPSIYYFYKIPAVVLPWTVFWVVVGALAIAVAASILPARRAARLHPVEALRYE